MPTTAGQPWLSGRTGGAGLGAIRAAAFAFLLSVAGCGDSAAPGDVSGQTTTPGSLDGASGPSTATGASDPVGSLTFGAGATLDTSTWLLPPPFSAAGDEPFWRMEIVDGWFSFRRSGLRAIEEPLAQPKREGETDVFETASLRIAITRDACETEGGGKGDYRAKVTYDGQDFDGCAFGGQAASAPASAEAADVANALVPIDACLAKLGQPALATAIYPRQDGDQTAVALLAKTGAAYECVTDRADGSVISLDPLEQGSQPSWMRRLRFLREGVAISAPCATAEEVRVGDRVVGRLLGKSCKF